MVCNKYQRTFMWKRYLNICHKDVLDVLFKDVYFANVESDFRRFSILCVSLMDVRNRVGHYIDGLVKFYSNSFAKTGVTGVFY